MAYDTLYAVFPERIIFRNGKYTANLRSVYGVLYIDAYSVFRSLHRIECYFLGHTLFEKGIMGQLR